DKRTVTLTHSGTDLTKITNPDGGLHTLAYDGSHHPTREDFGGLSTTYAYANNEVTNYTPLDNGSVTVNPGNLFGLSVLSAGGPVSITDGLGRTTRWLLDTSGRPTLQIAPDGGVTRYTRDANGWV